MEGVEGDSSAAGSGLRYSLCPQEMNNEDILICVDVEAESLVEMKTMGADGKPYTRLDAIKQAILLFVHSKLTINPEHRFAFATLSKSASWLRKEFSSDVESTIAAIRDLSASSTSSGQADLTNLFRIANHEGRKLRLQNRIVRVILIYCRSSVLPHHQWQANHKHFTLDVLYLHDKPGPDNRPQQVYDALVDALEHVSLYEGYIFESGHGIARTIFRFMSVLLSHPQQRYPQEELDIPKSLVKKVPTVESANGADSAPVSSQ